MTTDAPSLPEKALPGRPAPAKPSTPMFKLIKPYFYISGYYALLALVVIAAFKLSPGLIDYAPIGGAAEVARVIGADPNTLTPVAAPPSRAAIAWVASIKLALAIIAAFALMLPVTWICMGARRRKDVAQSFIQTILVLPMVITGIVHIVHDSLALAFSLAGIVAGVRFRHTLKDSAETTYLFTAIAVGVACGVNSVEIAAIVSIFFNYTVLGLWATEFGGHNTGKQMFSRQWMAKGEQSERKSKHDDDDDDD